MAVCPALKIYFGLFFSGAPQFAASGVGRTMLANVAAMLAANLLSAFLVNFAWWHRIGRTLRKAVPLLYFLAMFSGLGVYWQLSSHSPHTFEPLGATTLAWALRILPLDIFALTGIAIVFLGALYWIVSKQFCELEISPVQMKDLSTS
jgi:hypothetical protein